MNVLLLNPPYFPKFSRSQRSPGVIKSGVMYYPIWLAYATGALEKRGFHTQLIDAPARKLRLADTLEIVEKGQPRLVVLETSTPSIDNDIEVAEAIKAKMPDAFIVMVGPHATALPEDTIRRSKAVSAVVRGEYEGTLTELAEMVDGGSELSQVTGLTFRDCRSQEIVHNPNRQFLQDLDSLPFVSEIYKRHLNIRDYFYSITRYPEVAIITGRGCPYHCTYCVWPQTITGHGYRRRSIANVADEFDFIAREMPEVKEVFIEDDTLTVDAKRAVGLAEELIRQGNSIAFSANSRADIDGAILKPLKKAGLRLLCVGFESGDQQILDGIQKKIKIENFFQFRESARKAKVLIHGCFMAGNAGETKATLQKTLALALRLSPDTAQFFPVMVYPGTPAFDRAQEMGSITTQNFKEWLTPEGLHRSVLSYENFTGDDLVEWCNHARKKFYLRPKFIFDKIREILTSPQEGRRIFKAAATFGRYLIH